MKDGFIAFIVNLRVRGYGCNVWVLSCKHACACIAHKKANVEAYNDYFYSNKIYLIAHGEIIHPILEVPNTYIGGYSVTINPPRLKRL